MSATTPASGDADRDRLRSLADELANLITESLPDETEALDTLTTPELLARINRADREVAAAVGEELGAVADAVELIAAALTEGGRLFYLGAGTSGRLGVLDASECPPTFGSDPGLVTGVIAGGAPALVRSSEGLEDDGEQGWRDLREAGAGVGDVVVGITMSTRTPYVIEALRRAREAGLGTIYLTCNPERSAGVEADVTINPVVGPEVIAGSTRLKAGTATKMVLNMLTTATFVRLGRAYGHLMVDVRPVSDKLRARARSIVRLACGVDFDTAHETLLAANEDVPLAILALRRDCAIADAREILERDGHGRSLRDLLGGRPPAYLAEAAAGAGGGTEAAGAEPAGGADRTGAEQADEEEA